MNLIDLKERVINGYSLTQEEAVQLIQLADKEALYQAAHEITEKCADKTFDMCSIINAKSGNCSEHCKWCAQSAHFKTSVEAYSSVRKEECFRQARYY